MKRVRATSWPWQRRPEVPHSATESHPWHALPAAEALRLGESRASGLDDDEVQERRARYGRNVLPRGKRRSIVRTYASQFASPLIYLLLAAAAVSLAIGQLTDGVFIFVVLQINAVIGTFQEWKAQSSAESLRKLVPSWSVARRGGLHRRIHSEDLVPGDIVVVTSGTRLSADLRLLATHELKVDESLLTGESISVTKDALAAIDEHATLGERLSMLYAGTTATTGRGEGIVVATGKNTEIGRIAQAIATPDLAPPPLLVRLAGLVRVIGLVTVVLIALLGIALVMRGMAPIEVFIVAVALAVAAIPEGLPVAITVALAIGVNRMARRAVVVRQLPAVEGLGSCTLIASDKTGTLTLNELTVRHLFLPGIGDVDVAAGGTGDEGGLSRDGERLAPEALEQVRALALSGTLCNEATYHESEDGAGHFGDTVDVVILAFGRGFGYDRPSLDERFPQVAYIPFESQYRFAASFVRDDGRVLAHVKGAAETVIPMCAGIDREAMLAEAARLAGEGFRVIAVASGEVVADEVAADARGALKGLTLQGLVGMIDPARPEVPAAVRACHDAGITVRVITGDHPATALAVAREIDIAHDEGDIVSGAELAGLADDPAALDKAVARAHVFARVEPAQKLGIVQSLQRGGHFVAVTGDGVNDAPALRAANIGVAMGKGGTDIARDAADLILTDDNFASIVNGIEEGRIAYDNVRKVIFLLISTGAAEIVLFLLALAANLPLPLFAAQLLWLNLVTNGVQDVALAFEKGEPGVLRRGPRAPDEPIFDRRMIEQTLICGVVMGGIAFLFFAWCLERGLSEFDARNATLLLMVLLENAQAINARSEIRSVFRVPFAANPLLLIGIAGAQGIHLLAMYTPGLRDALNVAPLGLDTWLTVAGLAFLLIAVGEAYKALRRSTADA